MKIKIKNKLQLKLILLESLEHYNRFNVRKIIDEITDKALNDDLEGLNCYELIGKYTITGFSELIFYNLHVTTDKNNKIIKKIEIVF